MNKSPGPVRGVSTANGNAELTGRDKAPVVLFGGRLWLLGLVPDSVFISSGTRRHSADWTDASGANTIIGLSG